MTFAIFTPCYCRLNETKHIAGRIRTEQNWIGGGATPKVAQFIPPPPEHVPDLLEDLVTFSNREDLSAVAQAAIAHVQFETIHPFADGNGRVGRCLVHVILRRRGLARRIVPPISVVLAANADRYIAGLTAFRSGDVTVWCGIFSEATQVAADRAVELGTKLLELKSEWLERAGSPRRGSTARRLVEGLSAHPVAVGCVRIPVARCLRGSSSCCAQSARRREVSSDRSP